VTAAAWRDKRSWAVIATEDKAFDQAMLQYGDPQRRRHHQRARRSRPVHHPADAVADVIDTAARSSAEERAGAGAR
jgi:hypothetical protein